ncbi:hypothetical protein HMI56_002650, partial [Coelomomyces lativittatus]
IEKKLTGPDSATLEDVIRWVDRYTIDFNGKRHEGLVFKEEAGNYMRMVREIPVMEQRNFFHKELTKQSEERANIDSSQGMQCFWRKGPHT